MARKTPGDPLGVRQGDTETVREIARLERLAHTLDARYRIPLTPIRIGLDGLVGLITGIGDTLALAPSEYVGLRAWQLGARKRVLGRMATNTGIDHVIGHVLLVGDMLDIAFRANLRNVDLLKQEPGRPGRDRRR